MSRRGSRSQVIVRDAAVAMAATGRDFEAIVDLLDEGVVVMRPDGYLKYLNPAARQMYDLGPDCSATDIVRLAATSPAYNAEGERVSPDVHPAALAFRTGMSFTKEIYGIDLPNGERRWLLTSGRPLNPADPDSDILVSFSDITAQRADLDRLVYQANHDALTGLPNRAYVIRRIAAALASSGRDRMRAVLFIDLDDLKTTNDTLGHQAGDDLLNAAAKRLRQSVGPDDVVGRHGGDEFVVLINGNVTPGDLGGLVSWLRVSLSQPLQIADTTVRIRASVGVVEVTPDDVRTAEEILRDADRAMYKAKRAGRRPGR